ncbi:MAG: thiamine phosphate synthase, partial [Rhizobiaceae bacterium]|nr:thiamine phosphate synthase [Rhizobiaceae bacterium]
MDRQRHLLLEVDGPRAAVAEEALAIARLCRQAGATFIVNDWVEAARAWGADGVHLGERDQDPEVARRRL